MRQPTLYIPHGAGPCFFMHWSMGPSDTWDRMGEFLRGLVDSLEARPSALLVVSAHWEESAPTVTSGEAPPLYYDYYGFPQHTYELRWPAKGSATLADRVRSLLGESGIDSQADDRRGFDHGVFIPMLLSVPGADIPTVQLSLRAGLDARQHLAIGRALAHLRDEGVLIVGSGMSYHNMRGFGRASEASEAFDGWLTTTVEAEDAVARDGLLARWSDAPFAQECHPRSEHLTPLFVVAGAAEGDRGRKIFGDRVMSVRVSGFRFG